MKLVSPHVKYKESYIKMVQEFIEQGEAFVPFVLGEAVEDFPAMINRLKGYASGEIAQEGFVQHSTFWLIDKHEQVVGCSNLRHQLNDGLLVLGGHIGYGIRPSARKNGYAKTILKLTLRQAKSIGIENALVTVNKANTGSVKTIQFNNGVLEAEKEVPGQEGIVQYYWVPTE